MRITAVKLTNFMSFERFELLDLKKYNRLSGPNGAGKSAILEAITSALSSRGFDPTWIHTGEDEARVIIEIDNSLLVDRRISKTAQGLRVVDSDGTSISKPQTVLNDLIGPLNFDPIAFMDEKKPERRKMLLQAMPVTLTPEMVAEILGEDINKDIDYSHIVFDRHGLDVLDDVRQVVYDTRSQINAQVKQIEGSIRADEERIPVDFDPKVWDGFDHVEALDKTREMQDAIGAHKQKQVEIESIERRIQQSVNASTGLVGDITRQEEVIRSAKKNIKELQSEQKEREIDRKRWTTEMGKLQDTVRAFVIPDVDGLYEKIEDYNMASKIIETIQNRDIKKDEVKTIKARQDRYNDALADLTKKLPRTLIKQAKLPIEGLTLEGDDIFVNGISFDRLSTSEKLTFVVQLARALAGDLKVILIDRYESQTKTTRDAFAAMTKDDGFEYFITISDDKSSGLAVHSFGEEGKGDDNA